MVEIVCASSELVVCLYLGETEEAKIAIRTVCANCSLETSEADGLTF